MKKSVIIEVQRILEIMNGKLLTELNQRYLDQILDKINDSGIDSLSAYEKMALDKLSNNQDVGPEHIEEPTIQSNNLLRFTVPSAETGKPQARPKDMGKISGSARYKGAYVIGAAELIAGFDQVVFIDGDLSQLDQPTEEQQIKMILPQGEYDCVATSTPEDETGYAVYQLKLKEEDDDYNPEGLDDLIGMNEVDMNEYKVFDSGEMNEPLDMTEGNAFVGAAKKAKEEGKDSFNLNGKTYKVTISKSK